MDNHVPAHFELTHESLSANVAEIVLRDLLLRRAQVFVNGGDMAVD